MTRSELETEYENLYGEVERLRERVAAYEARDADLANPDVMILSGELREYEGEYSAWSVMQPAGHIYLTEAIEHFIEKVRLRARPLNSEVTISWNVTSEPRLFLDLQANVAAAALGHIKTEFTHRYSDLTGYLWTNERVEVRGHDIIREIADATQGIARPYLFLRAEVSK